MAAAKLGFSSLRFPRGPLGEAALRRALAMPAKRKLACVDVDEYVLDLTPPLSLGSFGAGGQRQAPVVMCRLTKLTGPDAAAKLVERHALHLPSLIPLVPADVDCASQLPDVLARLQLLSDSGVLPGGYGIYLTQGWDSEFPSRVRKNEAAEGLRWVQAPLSVVDKGALQTTVTWAASNDVGFIASLPLSAGGLRLVEGHFPVDYALVKESLLVHLCSQGEGGTWLSNLVGNIDIQLDQFESGAHWQSELAGRILPMIEEAFEELDEDTYQLLVAFFDRFGKAVKESAGAKTRARLQTELGEEPGSPLQHWALDWACQQESVRFVVPDWEYDDELD